MVKYIFILFFPILTFGQKVRNFTGILGASPSYTPVTVYDEKEAFNTSTGETWRYQGAWYNTGKLGTSSLHYVTTVAEIATKTYPTNSTIKVVSTGAEYKVRNTALTGYAADGVLVVQTGSNYACLQPTGVGYSLKHGSMQLQKLLDYVKASVIGTNGIVVVDTSITLTDSILIRENVQIHGAAPLGDGGTHPLDTPGKVVVTFNINNTNKSCFVFEDTGRGQVTQTGLKNVQIRVTSPAFTAVNVIKPYGVTLQNVRIFGDNTNRYLKYGVYYCCAVITTFDNVIIQDCSIAALYQYAGAFGSTSTKFKECYFTNSKMGIYLTDAEPFFDNCYVENIDSIGVYLSGGRLKWHDGGIENVPSGSVGAFVKGTGSALIENIAYGGTNGGVTTFSDVTGTTIVKNCRLYSYDTLIPYKRIGFWESNSINGTQKWESLSIRYNTIVNGTYITGFPNLVINSHSNMAVDSSTLTRSTIANGFLSSAVITGTKLTGTIIGGDNFAELSEDFTSTSMWSLNSNVGFNGAITRTANTSAAPNTEISADRITKNDNIQSFLFPFGSNVLPQYDSLILGQTYTWSCYVKKPVGSDIKFIIGGMNIASDTINPAADGNWYRISVTGKLTTKSNALSLYNIRLIGTSTNYADLWGYQMSRGGIDDYIQNSTTSGIFNKKRVRLGNIYIISDAGNPEGAEYAPKGSLYLREDGGASTTLYVKTTDNNLASGWSAK